MSKGLIFDPALGKITIVNGSRVVATTDGTLVNLETAYQTFNPSVVFPDVPKSYAYIWTTSTKNVPFSTPDKWQHGESCTTFITATAQEYSAKTDLDSAPTGADFFEGQVTLLRTSAPNAWMGRTLSVLPVQNQAIPMPGAFSALMEAEIGLARAMHVYLDDDPVSAHYRKLVLEVQQSVGPSIGGYASFGTTFAPTGGSANGGSVTGTGIPISLRAAASYGYTPPGGDTTQFAIGYGPGSGPCSTADNTSYVSIYAVNIVGRYGRRS